MNNTKLSNTQRDSNFELLRILLMLMIIAHHLCVHSDITFDPSYISINRLWIQLIQIGGKVGVNIFILISGYFLSVSNSIRIKKILKIWLQIFFYSIVIFLTAVALGMEPFTIKGLIKHVLPVTYSQWWFASTYFVLYLLSPYINKLIHGINKKAYHILLISTTIMWCFIPTFLLSMFQSNDLLWFIYLYILAGYVRKYQNEHMRNAKKLILLSVFFTFITFLSAFIFDLLGMYHSTFAHHSAHFYDMQSLPVLLISVSLFWAFKNINIPFNKTINVISSTTFGIYLIHDNKYVREFIWKSVFKIADYADSDYLIPYSIVVIVIVFVVCFLIELIRIKIFEENYMKFLQNIKHP